MPARGPSVDVEDENSPRGALPQRSWRRTQAGQLLSGAGWQDDVGSELVPTSTELVTGPSGPAVDLRPLAQNESTRDAGIVQPGEHMQERIDLIADLVSAARELDLQRLRLALGFVRRLARSLPAEDGHDDRAGVVVHLPPCGGDLAQADVGGLKRK